jgi:hypothetical protein
MLCRLVFLSKKPEQEGDFLMAVRIILWIARIAGVGAVLLGLFYWITGIDIVTFHMICGLLLSLSFLILSVTLVFQRGGRLSGIAGIVYALLLPIFGMAQSMIVTGDLHWLIRVAHLLFGIGALVVVQLLFTQYQKIRGDMSKKRAVVETPAQA